MKNNKHRYLNGCLWGGFWFGLGTFIIISVINLSYLYPVDFVKGFNQFFILCVYIFYLIIYIGVFTHLGADDKDINNKIGKYLKISWLVLVIVIIIIATGSSKFFTDTYLFVLSKL
ncbi:hypothetical protein AHYW_002741 [Providencia manganoxydans]|uniref:hypothetical protein n=1 Tax=Providencia TaxID=586 RepID=UPI001123DD86|nr:hypothetical protein [Providencia stuartii]